MRAFRGILAVLTFAAAASCGNGADGEPQAARQTPAPAGEAVSDTAAPTTAQRFAAVPLPPEFPTDFPLPSNRIVVEASATRDESGVFSRVGLAVEGEVGPEYSWYRNALAEAGWSIASEGRRNGAMTLHATQGESYVDLTVREYPQRDAAGWVLVEASIWKIEPL